MAAAAHMVDLKPLPRNQRAGADEHAGQHRDMIEKVHSRGEGIRQNPRVCFFPNTFVSRRSKGEPLPRRVFGGRLLLYLNLP